VILIYVKEKINFFIDLSLKQKVRNIILKYLSKDLVNIITDYKF